MFWQDLTTGSFMKLVQHCGNIGNCCGWIAEWFKWCKYHLVSCRFQTTKVTWKFHCVKLLSVTWLVSPPHMRKKWRLILAELHTSGPLSSLFSQGFFSFLFLWVSKHLFGSQRFSLSEVILGAGKYWGLTSLPFCRNVLVYMLRENRSTAFQVKARFHFLLNLATSYCSHNADP